MYPEDSNYGKKRGIKHDVKHFRHEISDLSTVTMFMFSLCVKCHASNILGPRVKKGLVITQYSKTETG